VKKKKHKKTHLSLPQMKLQVKGDVMAGWHDFFEWIKEPPCVPPSHTPMDQAMQITLVALLSLKVLTNKVKAVS
jgi:hypothetical protein